MLRYTHSLNNRCITCIVQRTFNHVDSRLIDHGLRVAYLVARMLQRQGGYTPMERRNICFLAALHDIGAYKTEEIDKMVQFETGTVWDHAIYGYLFLKHFSPFQRSAPVVLFHHADWKRLEPMTDLDDRSKNLAQLFNIADRADIYFEAPGRGMRAFCKYLERVKGEKFSPQAVECFMEAGLQLPIEDWNGPEQALEEVLGGVPFNEGELDSFLRMLIYAIDFRSRHTVTHTITTESVSRELAGLMGVGEEETAEIVCGALLHDLGKIGIPVEILEFPGKLSPQAMRVMRTHVDLTGEILGDTLSPSIRRIALRHHEKLDGSGYPLGLRGESLTLSERIVAVSDIVSALCGARSYKEAFPREKTLGIVAEMSRSGLIDSRVVDMLTAHFDGIMEKVRESCDPVLEKYRIIQKEYDELSHIYAGSG